MNSFIKEINEFSFGNELKKSYFENIISEKKTMYLERFKNLNSFNTYFYKFNHLIFDKEMLETSIDISFKHSKSTEKDLISKRANNIFFIQKLEILFENCRKTCKIPESRLRNINIQPKMNQNCLTDCLNIRSELMKIQKPCNQEKAFIWI